MTLKQEYMTGRVTWREALCKLDFPQDGWKKAKAMIDNWEAEKLEMAREDPITLTRALALAMSNCGMSVVGRDKVELLTLTSHWWGGLIEGQWFPGCDSPEWRGKLESYAEIVMARETISWVDRVAPYMGNPLPEYWSDIGELVDSLEEWDLKACAQRVHSWLTWDPDPVVDPYEEYYGQVERVVLVEEL